MQTTVSILIPVLNAEKYLPALFEAFDKQLFEGLKEIVLVDSNSTDRTVEMARARDDVTIIPINDFSHGRSRNMGAREASGDVIAMLSQDALPRDENWLKELVAPFEDAQVAATYSRQVPRDDASPMERHFLLNHFSEAKVARRSKDATNGPLNLKSVFFSNVSSAVRRKCLLEHPFDEELIMSEDQQLSRDLIEAGYAVVYVPDSVVLHSHNYKLGDVFRRYFDSVYSLTQIFKEHGMGTSATMGIKYLLREVLYIIRWHPLWLPYYFCYTFCKSAGTIAGHFAEKMPKWMVRRCSLHTYHWD